MDQGYLHDSSARTHSSSSSSSSSASPSSTISTGTSGRNAYTVPSASFPLFCSGNLVRADEDATDSSKRAFQTQFRKWQFPSKQNPAYKNDQLVARVKELWEKNMSQQDILRRLKEDGYSISNRGLMQVRTQNHMYLRKPHGDKSAAMATATAQVQAPAQERLDSRPSSRGSMKSSQTKSLMSTDASREGTPYLDADFMPSTGVPEAKFTETVKQARARSEGNERKRRRRTRGWKGEPADPPGPPRYPSETTIDEARVILSLDNEGYQAMRTSFKRICEENNVVKKTMSGPETWEKVKETLIRDVPQLHAPFWTSPENMDQKKLALDVICTDVTKRMRVLEKRMTLAEAKQALGVDPEEARQLRTAFFQIITDAAVRCKSSVGQDEWNKLKDRWFKGSKLIQRILQPHGGPEHQEKLKALEVIASDVMKRARDDKTRRAARRNVSAEERVSGRSPTPATHGTLSPPMDIDDEMLEDAEVEEEEDINHDLHQPSPASHVGSNDTVDSGDFGHVPPIPPIQLVPSPATTPMHVPVVPLASQTPTLHGGDLSQAHSPHRLLPAMLDSPASLSLDSQMGGPLLLPHDASATFVDQQYVPQFTVPSAFHHHPHHHHTHHAVASQSMTIPVYLRLDPHSTIVTNQTMWITTLSSHSLNELRHRAAEKIHGAICLRVEGILKDGKGNEMPLSIEQDAQLSAYLTHLEGATPMFDVQLMWSV